MSMNIYQRINEVRKKINYIQKDKAVQGYKAVTHDAVTGQVRNALIEHGVVIIPRLVSSQTLDVGKTKSGATIVRHEAVYDIDFVNMDDPADKFTARTEGHANDSGDKAPGKATSYATKYAILKVFNIETGENEESRVEAYAEKISDEQAADIEQKIKSYGIDRAGFMAWLKRDIKAAAIKDINENGLPMVLAALERKKPQEQAA